MTRVLVGDSNVPTSVLTIDAGLKLPEAPEEPRCRRSPRSARSVTSSGTTATPTGCRTRARIGAGVLAQLINDDGDVVAETKTDSDGNTC